MIINQIEQYKNSIVILKKSIFFVFFILSSNFSFTQNDFKNWDSVLVIQRVHLKDTTLFIPCLYKDLVLDTNKVIDIRKVFIIANNQKKYKFQPLKTCVELTYFDSSKEFEWDLSYSSTQFIRKLLIGGSKYKISHYWINIDQKGNIINSKSESKYFRGIICH